MELLSQLNQQPQSKQLDNTLQTSPLKQKNQKYERKQDLGDLSSRQSNRNDSNEERQDLQVNIDQDLSGCSSDDEFEDDSETENDKFQYDKLASHLQENRPEINRDKENITENASSQNNLLSLYDEDELEMRKDIINSIPTAIPIITSQYSLKPDMMFGWKPQINITGAPIPLYFDYEWFDIPVNPLTNEEYDVSYYGHRYKDSLEMHKSFANKSNDSYKFKFPPNLNVLEAMSAGQKRKREDQPREFVGMNPIILNQQGILNSKVFTKPSLQFDSRFESGNLDMAIQVRDNEYDLYMRVDSNTRGHHQWFNFTVSNNNVRGKIKFNIVNFTKNASLYHQGMKINIFSQKNYEQQVRGNQNIENEGWIKGGENIVYKLSKLSQVPYGQKQVNVVRYRRYFQLSFEHDFSYENDKVQFSYSVPYTFSRIFNLVKQISKDHISQIPDIQNQFVKEGQLCKSISGLEVPILTVTSRVNRINCEEIDPYEFLTSEVEQESSPPLNKYKKYIIICSRVHPGETNASFIMEGFLKFIASPTNPEAIELRKRIIFKVIPMTNPDGVIVGNYRTGLCGNDLNRQFISPNTKIHPTVCAIKALVSGIIQNAKEPEPITSFIDIHGHSRKKSIFIYGPYFPLHNERYLKMRVLPKLLSERTEMFRFFSCKFRIQKSKLKAARVVLWKEFGIMNCFTLEASFHGFINKDRQTIHLTTENLMKMGDILGSGFYEYQTLVEEDDKQKMILKQQIKNKKKRMKAKDIVHAYTKQQEQQIQNKIPSNVISGENQLLSSDAEEKKISSSNNERSQSQNIQRIGQMRDLNKNANIGGQLQKRTFSLGIKEQNNLITSQQFNKKQESSQQILLNNNDYQNKVGVETVIEVKRSSAENSSKNSQIRMDEQTSSLRDASDMDLQTRKPFRIKKSKIPLSGAIQKENAGKRTLKSIYKLLKRDMKNLSLPINGLNSTNDQQVKPNNNGNISSESEDSDDDANDCCENEESDINDDLSPSELEELQSNILEAIENFDKIYNKYQTKGEKGKKKTKSSNQNQQLEGFQNMKSIQIDQSNMNDLQRLIGISSQKEPGTSKNKQKQDSNNSGLNNNQSFQQTYQMIKHQPAKKLQNQMFMNNVNSNRVKQQDSLLNGSQYSKYIGSQQSNNNIVSGQSIFKQQANNFIMNDKLQNSSFPLQVSGMLVKQNLPHSMNRKQLTSKDVNKSNPQQNEILSQGLSTNVRNLIKFVNPQFSNMNPRNQITPGSAQFMNQSKSQDKYRQNDNTNGFTSNINEDDALIKSFENFQNKLQSKSSNQRPSAQQNRSQINDGLQKSQIIESSQQVLGLLTQNNLQQSSFTINSRTGHANQSKSSRVILESEKGERSGRESMQPLSTGADQIRFAGKNSQITSIRTPKGQYLQNKGALIINTPSNQPSLQPLSLDDKERQIPYNNKGTSGGTILDTESSKQSKSLRAYSLTTQINSQKKQNTSNNEGIQSNSQGVQSHKNILSASEELKTKVNLYSQQTVTTNSANKEIISNKTVVHNSTKNDEMSQNNKHLYHQSFGLSSQSQQPLSFNLKQSENDGQNNLSNLIHLNSQNIFKQNIFKIDQALNSLNQVQLPTQSGQNQSLIIQNIIIGNYHNDQRIQINSPNSQANDQDQIRDDIIQKHKKKRKKSKRKSKDKKLSNGGGGFGYPNQLNDNSIAQNNNTNFQQYQVMGTSAQYSNEPQRNSLISSGGQQENQSHKFQKPPQGLKYIGLQTTSADPSRASLNPYSESQNFDRRRIKIPQYSAQTNTQNQSNLFISEGDEDASGSGIGNKFNQKRSSEKSQQPLYHQKKLSIEYDQLLKLQEKDNSVLGPSHIYNLRPLKDMIQNNLNQSKYSKNQIGQDQQNVNSVKRTNQNPLIQSKNQTYYNQKFGMDSSHFVVPSTTESGRQIRQQPILKPGRQLAPFPSKQNN